MGGIENQEYKYTNDPVVTDTVKRLRDKGERLTNGDSDDIEAIGQAVGELCNLMASFVESQPPTKATCKQAQQEMVDHFEEKISGLRRGINWPTAFTILSGLAIIGGSMVKIFG